MNADVRFAVKFQLAAAKDNLTRASLAFRETDLTAQHGQSGKTRGQVLAEYQDEVARWEAALASLA